MLYFYICFCLDKAVIQIHKKSFMQAPEFTHNFKPEENSKAILGNLVTIQVKFHNHAEARRFGTFQSAMQ